MAAHDVYLPTFLVAKIEILLYLWYSFGTNGVKRESDFGG